MVYLGLVWGGGGGGGANAPLRAKVMQTNMGMAMNQAQLLNTPFCIPWTIQKLILGHIGGAGRWWRQSTS